MTYETLVTIASLLEKEKNIREKECELLREKLNSARDKADFSPEDSDLSREVDLPKPYTKRPERGFSNMNALVRTSLSMIFDRKFINWKWDKSIFSVET